MTNLLTITVSDAMTQTGFPRSMVYDLVRRGEWESVRVGHRGQFRILHASIAHWFERNRQTPSPVLVDSDALLPAVKEPAFQ